MIEDDVTGIKARKRIEISPKHGIDILVDIPSHIEKRAACSHCVLDSHKKRHQIGNCLLREGNRYPEERTSPEVKRKCAGHGAAQIHVPVPEKLSIPHSPVSQNIERDLLNIVVSVIKERQPSFDQDRKNGKNIHQKGAHEHDNQRIPCSLTPVLNRIFSYSPLCLIQKTTSPS